MLGVSAPQRALFDGVLYRECILYRRYLSPSDSGRAPPTCWMLGSYGQRILLVALNDGRDVVIIIYRIRHRGRKHTNSPETIQRRCSIPTYNVAWVAPLREVLIALTTLSG